MNKPTMRFALFFVAVFMATQLFAFRADEPVFGPTKATMTTAITAAPLKMPTDDQKKAVKSLDGAQVEWDAKTGAPASIRGKDLSSKNIGGKGLSLSQKNNFAVDAIAVMDCLTEAYRLRDASAEFKTLKPEADELGFHHVRMNQMYQGLRVVGGQLIMHFNKSGQACQVNGRYIPGIDIETKAVIDANSAIAAAQQDIVQLGKPAGNLKGALELVVYAQDIAPLLAYELTLVYNDEKAGMGNWRYWINARDGSVINRFNDIRKIDAAITGNILAGEGGQSVSITGDNRGGYYWLRYTGRHWEIYNYATSGYVDNNSIARRTSASWGTSDQTEISAAYNFNLVQTYYYDIHSRNSYDGSGVKALANVHVSGDTDNAYWDPDTQQFYFYPGSYFGDLTVLDVCAHEFTHAVTEKTADLVYQYESGALNESFSDIFGAVIEFASQPDGRASYPARTAGYADWLIGEDSTYPYDVALRDMRNPRRYNNPNKYRGTDWYYGSGDNGGVHYNNGVQNHFFYLLCEGGSGNNDGISYNITGIGVENARRIAYRALTVYCTRNTDYAAARTAWISAAIDLNSSWVSAVQAAWAAVGVGIANSIQAPTGVTASDGTYSDRVRVTWTPVAIATGYQIWRYTNSYSELSSQIGTSSTTGYDDTTAAAGTLYYYWVKATDQHISAFSGYDTGFAAAKIGGGPAIKANGTTGEIIVNYPDTVSVTVEMNAGDYAGAPVDWWVVALAGSSWFYLNSAVSWAQEGAWRPVYQGALGNLPATEVLNMTGLQIGSYTFWFAVDYPMDGVLTEDAIWFDSVNVTVQ